MLTTSSSLLSLFSVAFFFRDRSLEMLLLRPKIQSFEN